MKSWLRLQINDFVLLVLPRVHNGEESIELPYRASK